MLGNQFWHTYFGRDPSVVGSQLSLDGESYTVVGVLPRGRPWLDYADVYLPMIRDPNATRSSFEIAVIGRLRPGVSLEAGRSDLEGVAFLEMWVQFDGAQYFSRGLNDAVKNKTAWKTVQTPFFFQQGQSPDKVVLNLVINGKGTVWVDDIVLSKAPLTE